MFALADNKDCHACAPSSTFDREISTEAETSHCALSVRIGYSGPVSMQNSLSFQA